MEWQSSTSWILGWNIEWLPTEISTSVALYFIIAPAILKLGGNTKFFTYARSVNEVGKTPNRCYLEL